MLRRIFGLLLAALLLGNCAVAEEIDTSGIADASEMTDVIDIVTDDMVPVTADQLRDGTYPVAVDVSSSMFKVNRCELIVAGKEHRCDAGSFQPFDCLPGILAQRVTESDESDFRSVSCNVYDGSAFFRL